MDDRAPFIGPRPFTEDDADVFFGRKIEIASLAAEVASTQIVLLYAPSGSGKSSLISAGLVPALRDEEFQVTQVRLNTLAPTPERRIGSLRDAIQESAAQSSADRPSLLVLDQFEEVVVSTTRGEVRAVSEVMIKALAEKPQARILLSFREEYLARTIPLFNRAVNISSGNFALTRLTKRGAEEAFRCPLEALGFHVDSDAVNLFLERLATRTQGYDSEATYEPLYLQLLGTQLWSSIGGRAGVARSPHTDVSDANRPVVTGDDVRGLINFDQAIEIFFNSTISDVCARRKVQQKATRDWIDRELVTTDETRSMVRRQAEMTKGLPTSVLDDLTRRGLLRTEPRGDDLWLELAHDQLVERVRELNRVWWTGRIYARLQDRSTRKSIAMEASNYDLVRWMVMRGSLWGLAAAVRETGVRFSRRYGGLLPFARKREGGELDRLALRAFVLGGSLVNTGLGLYRAMRATETPTAVNVLEGLDSQTAKRRLQATALNLGRAGQLLASANYVVTISWVWLMSRLLVRSAVGGLPADLRRRGLIAVLLGTDATLGLLRWAIRYGLIVNCLGDEGQTQQPTTLRPEHPPIRRSTNLDEVAAWSSERPVLLVLDWHGRVDADTEFDRFANREVPIYLDALRARGAMAVWGRRADLRRRGWRDPVPGVGFPAWGQRIYYVIERGNVTAWRVVGSGEVPMGVQLDEAGNMPQTPQMDAAEKRFKEVVTALVVLGEVVPSPWGQLGEMYFKARPLRRGGKAV